MFETEARRKRIVDARASRQFATQQLAVEAERRGRDRPAAEAGGRIDPLGLLGPPDERRPLTLDVGKQARDGCAIRSSEPPSTDAVGLTSPFSIRDREARLTPLSAESSSSDQLRARRNARRRSARRISAASQDGAWYSTSGRILSEMRASRRSFRHRARRAPNLRAPPFSCTLGAYSNGMDRCRRHTTPPPFRPGPGPSGRVASVSGSADSQIKEDRTK